jgi:hypothetical protein
MGGFFLCVTNGFYGYLFIIKELNVNPFRIPPNFSAFKK